MLTIKYMNDVQFLNWVTPRVGPVNAVNAAHSARVNALVELLVQKGIFTQKEIDDKNTSVFEKIQKQILSLPVVSPIQNRPHQYLYLLSH